MLSREELNKLRDELLSNDRKLTILDKNNKCVCTITADTSKDDIKSITIHIKINEKGNWNGIIVYSYDTRNFTEAEQLVLDKLEEYTNSPDCKIETKLGASTY